MLPRVALAGLAVAAATAGCSTNTQNAATADEPCSAYIDTHDGNHSAVTEHMGALLLATWTDAKAPPGKVHTTPVTKFIGKMDDSQLKAAERVSTAACRLLPSSSSVLYAVTSTTGLGRVQVPAVLQP